MKARQADAALADVFMSIPARSERSARIVGVNYLHRIPPEDGFDCLTPQRKTCGICQIKTCCVAMRGIQAASHRQIRTPYQRSYFFQIAPERSALARGVLDQYRQSVKRQTARAFFEPGDHVRDRSRTIAALGTARMQDQVFSANRQST